MLLLQYNPHLQWSHRLHNNDALLHLCIILVINKTNSLIGPLFLDMLCNVKFLFTSFNAKLFVTLDLLIIWLM